MAREASTVAAGLDGGLAGVPMRTVSMRVVMLLLPSGAGCSASSPIGPTGCCGSVLERAFGGISEASSHEGSNGDAGLTGDLFGASMRTVSMRVVIVPPRFEGLPTASSQTVPMDGCFPSILSLLMIDQRSDRNHSCS